jgi:uroporphyrinogen-III synthase
MRKVVVLRPEPGASDTRDRAAALGLKPVLMALFEVVPVPWQTPDVTRFDALLLTSANAVRHGGDQLQQLRGLKAHCVGQATAEAARSAGFDIASVGKSGVERLLGSIENDQRLLHLCGQHRKQNRDAQQEITTIVVYRSTELPPPRNIREAEGAIVLIHSPRAGARFAHLADETHLERGSIAIAAISDAAAEVTGQGWERCAIADKPEERTLLELARTMCNTAKQ